MRSSEKTWTETLLGELTTKIDFCSLNYDFKWEDMTGDVLPFTKVQDYRVKVNRHKEEHCLQRCLRTLLSPLVNANRV